MRSFLRTSCICGDAFHPHHYAPRPCVCPGWRPFHISSRIHHTRASSRPTNINAQSHDRVSIIYYHCTQTTLITESQPISNTYPLCSAASLEFSESTNIHPFCDFTTYQTVAVQYSPWSLGVAAYQCYNTTTTQ